MRPSKQASLPPEKKVAHSPLPLYLIQTGISLRLAASPAATVIMANLRIVFTSKADATFHTFDFVVQRRHLRLLDGLQQPAMRVNWPHSLPFTLSRTATSSAVMRSLTLSRVLAMCLGV